MNRCRRRCRRGGRHAERGLWCSAPLRLMSARREYPIAPVCSGSRRRRWRVNCALLSVYLRRIAAPEISPPLFIVLQRAKCTTRRCATARRYLPFIRDERTASDRRVQNIFTSGTTRLHRKQPYYYLTPVTERKTRKREREKELPAAKERAANRSREGTRGG